MEPQSRFVQYAVFKLLSCIIVTNVMAIGTTPFATQVGKLDLALTPASIGDDHRVAGSPTESLFKPPDRAGLISDTRYFFSYQIAFLGLIYTLPEDISGWSTEQKHGNPFDKWSHNVTHPEWDHDKWYINYIAHPYFGGTYYVRARERGYDPNTSFWYSAVMSLSWEMGLEALAEPVSIQDVIVTPTFGKWVGDYFMDIRRPIISKSSITRSYSDKFLLFLTDPIGVLNNYVRRTMGWNEHLEISLSSTQTNKVLNPISTLLDEEQKYEDRLDLSISVRW